METLAKRIINRIVLWSNHEYAEEDIEVFYYGAECMLNSLSVDFVLLL
jgi:accessory gene regulator B